MSTNHRQLPILVPRLKSMRANHLIAGSYDFVVSKMSHTGLCPPNCRRSPQNRGRHSPPCAFFASDVGQNVLEAACLEWCVDTAGEDDLSEEQTAGQAAQGGQDGGGL